jgi:hypothetical protein
MRVKCPLFIYESTGFLVPVPSAFHGLFSTMPSDIYSQGDRNNGFAVIERHGLLPIVPIVFLAKLNCIILHQGIEYFIDFIFVSDATEFPLAWTVSQCTDQVALVVRSSTAIKRIS